jgi:hypothetical protein
VWLLSQTSGLIRMAMQRPAVRITSRVSLRRAGGADFCWKPSASGLSARLHTTVGHSSHIFHPHSINSRRDINLVVSRQCKADLGRYIDRQKNDCGTTVILTPVVEPQRCAFVAYIHSNTSPHADSQYMLMWLAVARALASQGPASLIKHDDLSMKDIPDVEKLQSGELKTG